MGTAALQKTRIRLTDEEFKAIRDLIYQKSGLFFAHKKKYFLESRLSERLKVLNLKTYDEYYCFLKYDPQRFEELSTLFDLITISETSFFRDPAQLRAFETKVLPEIMAKKEGSFRKIKIWSAGCSTGEEPYTLAIIVLETLKGAVSQWGIEILASDISEASLQVARKGAYNEHALRNVLPEVRLKYFSANKDGSYSVKETVKKLVRFSNINLFDQPRLRIVQGQDVIFCRNVLIYFGQEAKRQVVASLYDALNPGGYLFIGYSESLHGISEAFKPVHFTQVIGYKKE